MRKPVSLILLTVIASASLPLFSCNKTLKHVTGTMVDSPTVPIDTLTQSVYTIDSTTSPAKGIILCAPFSLSVLPTQQNTGELLMMDQSGKVLQKVYTPGTAFCLNRWIINGETRYTYLVNSPGALRYANVNQNAGYAVIADSNLHTLQQIYFTPFGDSLFLAGQSLDVHDFVLISDNHYIDLTYDVKLVTNIPTRLHPAPGGTWVVAPVIEEVNDGQVVWHWDGSADTAFYANSVEGNKFSDGVNGQDYIHMNSLFVDPRDSNLICSMRNQDQIIKIDRHSGNVLWRLGGANSDFKMDSDQVFLRQHHATLTDNNQTLMIFDDGEATQRPTTRIVEFQLDENAKAITASRYFYIPETFSTLMGSVQKIGNEYFIGGGTGNYMLDVNYVTGQKIIEFLGSQTTYRAYKF